jgi:hypothetical protein
VLQPSGVKSGKTGIWHARSDDSRYEHGCYGIWKAISLYDMKHTDIRRAVITDPSDPKFDLEAYLTQVQKDNP